jgi:hypothetical protein
MVHKETSHNEPERDEKPVRSEDTDRVRPCLQVELEFADRSWEYQISSDIRPGLFYLNLRLGNISSPLSRRPKLLAIVTRDSGTSGLALKACLPLPLDEMQNDFVLGYASSPSSFQLYSETEF